MGFRDAAHDIISPGVGSSKEKKFTPRKSSKNVNNFYSPEGSNAMVPEGLLAHFRSKRTTVILTGSRDEKTCPTSVILNIGR